MRALVGACNEALQLGLSDKDLSRLASWVWFKDLVVFMVDLLNGKRDMTMNLRLHTVLKRMVENELAMVLLLSITNLKGIQSFRYVTYT